jgi:maleate isomerase
MKSCLVKGPEWEAATCRDLSAGDVPFGTAGTTLRAALDALGARRVAVFSPYGDDVAELVPAYFSAAGYELVANVNRSSLADPYVVVSTHPEDLFRSIVSLPSADALCILATDLPTFQILGPLEQTWGGPVLTSNLAILWWLLRSAGVRDALPQLGTLGKVPAVRAPA